MSLLGGIIPALLEKEEDMDIYPEEVAFSPLEEVVWVAITFVPMLVLLLVMAVMVAGLELYMGVKWVVENLFLSPVNDDSAMWY